MRCSAKIQMIFDKLQGHCFIILLPFQILFSIYIWAMATSKNKFTLKILLSYLVLSALSVMVGAFLFSEFEKLTSENISNLGEKKFIETGTLINLVYEADGFSRLALLTENDQDFEKYMLKTDTLFLKIKEIKSLLNNEFQVTQLDSIKSILLEKNQNIEQLRILRLTNQKDTSLDEILKEVQKLETSIGLISVETLFKNPGKLSKKERKVWQSYADYLNSNFHRDTSTVKSKTVDSMLTASRYIVSEAKKENSRIRESLRQKENELIRNDLNISEKLRQIIASFDAEITRNNHLDVMNRTASIQQTGQVLKFTGVLGAAIMLIFSYVILSDYFKAERFKKNLEESKNYAEFLLKSREQLISTVSHDLKSPLNTISGYAELIGNTSISEKQKYYLSQINSSSHFISHLVDDLLDYSKLEAGKLTIEYIPFSLENITVEAANAVKQAHPLKVVELDISISETIKGTIFESDPLRIRQVLNNLLSNAFKFTDRGTVAIEVKELKTVNEIVTVAISVRDTGIGISKEKQETIFEEFTQATADIAHKFGGSGLGLAIAKKLTGLLGGNLVVASELGKGSTFTLTLPLKRLPLLNPSSSQQITTFQGLNAVIIDDDPAIRALLMEILQQMNIPSKSFGSFDEFISDAHKIDFNFIITDIQMPTADGFSILRRLKKGEVISFQNQPVFAITGSREHSRNTFLGKGFAEILRKPFSKEVLIGILQKEFSENCSFSDKSNVDQSLGNPKAKGQNFNLDYLISFLDTPENLKEVLTVFTSQTEVDLRNLKKAVLEGDVKMIKDTAHRMLTMFRQLKADEVIPILEKMENYPLENNETVRMKIDYEKLVLNFRAMQKELQELRL